MGTSVVPQMLDALIAASKAVLEPAIRVYDGPGVSADPGDFLAIGVDDMNFPGFAATSAQAVGPFATTKPRDETGSVICIAYSWNGDSQNGQKVARDAAYSYMGAVENLLRANPSLGILVGGNSGYFVAQMGARQDFSQQPNGSGVDALLIFDIAYFTRI